MRLTASTVNPLKDFLQSIADHDEEWIQLTTNNLPIIAIYFNSGGLICESHEEVLQLLELLSEYDIIEVKGNKLRITENGKIALEASKRSICSI